MKYEFRRQIKEYYLSRPRRIRFSTRARENMNRGKAKIFPGSKICPAQICIELNSAIARCADDRAYDDTVIWIFQAIIHCRDNDAAAMRLGLP